MIRRNTMLRSAVCITAVALLTTGCASSAADDSDANSKLEQLRADGVIRVANTQTNPPFSFVDESNNVVGFDVDVAEELAQRMGIDNVEYVVGTFQTFIPGLQSDKWDAVVAGLTITEERQEQVEFTCPYLVNEVSLFAADGTDGVDAIDGEEDLAGWKIAATAGGVQEQKLSEIDGLTPLTYDNATLALRDVATGRADLYVGSKFTGAYLAKQNDLDVGPIDASLSGLLSTEITGIAFARGEEELTEAANQALEGMIADGTLSEISGEWFGGLDVVEGLASLPESDCRP